MKPDTFYFPHDYNASQDHKILALLYRCGLEGLGAYWATIELLHQQPDASIPYAIFEKHIRTYAKINNKSDEQIKEIYSALIETKLLRKEGDSIVSDRVRKNKQDRELISEKRSKAGKISAEKRFGKRITNYPKKTKTIADTEKVRKFSGSASQKYFYDKFKEKTGKDYVADFGKDGKIFKSIKNVIPEEHIITLIDRFFALEDEFIREAGYTIGVFKSQINKLSTKKEGSKWIIRQ